MASATARIDLDARHILGLSSDALRASVISHMRDELLTPNQACVALVLTDWDGTMPGEVRSILGDLLRAQRSLADGHGDSGGSLPGLCITALDLHGKLGWFAAMLKEWRGAFESRASGMQSLELSLVDDETYLSDFPRFGNLRVLRLYQPELGADRDWLTALLRHNLPRLAEFACVSKASAEPFLIAVRELDATPAAAAEGPPGLAELAAACVIDAGTTAEAVSEHGYPPLAVAALERVEAGARERKTSLWLRGGEAALCRCDRAQPPAA